MHNKIKFPKSAINAFTLVEVLLTIAVIGIVAALTVPVLLQNIQDIQYRAGLKKAYADISQAAMKVINDNGSMNGIFSDSDKMKDLFKPYLIYKRMRRRNSI